MPGIDQFESVFRSAAKPIFERKEIAFASVLVVTDKDRDGTVAIGERVRAFLGAVTGSDGIEWAGLSKGDFSGIKDLLDQVGERRPDLIVTYRHLHSDGWRWPFSLGEHLDVLTQSAPVPVLVLPHPDAGREAAHALENTDVVMALTDHLAGDAWLVSYAVAMTQKGGKVVLAHVEDGAVFDRYIETIGKIPSINTEEAREMLLEQLLREPRDYIASCAEVLTNAGSLVTVESVVRVGHRLSEYASLVTEHEVDLLVINTKDHEQLAMHGLAYAVAVEVRQIPVLML